MAVNVTDKVGVAYSTATIEHRLVSDEVETMESRKTKLRDQN